MTEAAEALMTTEEMNTTLVELKKKIDKAQLEQQMHSRLESLEEGRKFLAENARKNGVITLPSGLQYMVLAEGSGKKPQGSDMVTISYRGTLISGREFDSSARRDGPVTVPLADIFLPGWQEALPLMREGAKWQLFLPSPLAFGETGPLADKAVIYELELVSVAAAPAKE
jgi:FKBP-type peptidyl-prolyl cis-trans isomerase FklB